MSAHYSALNTCVPKLLLKENKISEVKIDGELIVKPAREDNSNGVTHVKKRDTHEDL